MHTFLRLMIYSSDFFSAGVQAAISWSPFGGSPYLRKSDRCPLVQRSSTGKQTPGRQEGSSASPPYQPHPTPMISIVFWLLSDPFTGAFVRTKREATPETFSLVLRFHFHWYLAHQILSICFRLAPHQVHIAEVEGKIVKRSTNHVSLLS